LILPKIDRGGIHPIVNIVNAKHPFRLKSLIFTLLWPIGCPDVQTMKTGQSSLISKPKKGNDQALKFKLTYREIGGLSRLVDKIGIKTPLFIEFKISKKG